jgi:hypothetical protein
LLDRYVSPAAQATYAEDIERALVVPPLSSFCVNAMMSPVHNGFMIHATRWKHHGGIPNEQMIQRSGSGSCRRHQELSHGARSFVATGSIQNKYEMSAWVQEARAQGITNLGEVWRYARRKEINIHGG